MPTQKASTKSPTSPGTPGTLAPTNEPTKKCLKKGKWVKREYKQHGKGCHVYYAFDENLCAEYESDFFRPSGGNGGTNDNGPHQAVVFNKYSESSGGSSSSSRTGRRKYHRKPRKPRDRKKQTRIWIREENNLRRGRN
jgi:hypothetical protein